MESIHDLVVPQDGGVPISRMARDRAGVGRPPKANSIWAELSWTDRLLSPFIIVSMILGVVIGEFAPNAKESLTRGDFHGTPAPLAVGLIIMMWPILTKVQFEKLPCLLRTTRVWIQILLSLLLNWILAPLLMLGLAWACLPDLPGYRTGVILVGLARCIAMVMVWSSIARGDANVCAIIVIFNSLLQILLYAPLAVLFVNIISRSPDQIRLNYPDTALSVVVYLGIPLLAGVSTRFLGLHLMGQARFEKKFLPYFGLLSLAALLYTIIIIFAEQAHSILSNLGAVFRTFVPLILYFALVWTGTFVLIWRLSQRFGKTNWGYQMAVVQSFTTGSNNFELAIAICVAIYGADSEQSLAATIGPLVEVPVLLTLSYVALYAGSRMQWDIKAREENHSCSVDMTTSGVRSKAGAESTGQEQEDDERLSILEVP